MSPRLRRAYLLASIIPGAFLTVTRVLMPRLPKWSGCVIPDWVGPFFLALTGACLATAVLAVVGGALWLGYGLRGRWDMALAITSAVNASTIVYIVVAEPPLY